MKKIQIRHWKGWHSQRSLTRHVVVHWSQLDRRYLICSEPVLIRCISSFVGGSLDAANDNLGFDIITPVEDAKTVTTFLKSSRRDWSTSWLSALKRAVFDWLFEIWWGRRKLLEDAKKSDITATKVYRTILELLLPVDGFTSKSKQINIRRLSSLERVFLSTLSRILNL